MSSHTSPIVRESRRADIEAYHRRVEGISRAALIVREQREAQQTRNRRAAMGTLTALAVVTFVASVAVLV